MFTRSCYLAGFYGLALASAAFGQNLSLKPVVTSGLSSPLFVTAAPDDNNRLFIVEKGGAIRLFDRTTGTLQATPYLNLSSSISTNGERGLLGLAFDPDFATNGRLYVNYTDSDGDIIIARHVANGDALTSTSANSVGMQMMAPIEHSSQSNHNGGWIGFKPAHLDNNTPSAERHHLYVSVGDGGGGSNDPNNNGQNTNTLLGAMLRIDVSGDGPATIPSNNPFVSAPGADEIWDYGLRNAWRSSFDRATGDLWIADVGQDAFEEINFHAAGEAGGKNFGWDLAEGNSDNPLFTDPVFAYPHVPGPPNGSVTGGYVYRGDQIPGLHGHYFFGDFLNGRIFSFEYDGVNISPVMEHTDQLLPTGPASFAGGLVSFGEDADGELYVVDIRGAIYQIVPEPGSTQILFTALVMQIYWRCRRRSTVS